MSGTFDTKTDPGEPIEPMIYQVRIEGHLGNAWTNWFDGFTIRRTNNGETLLTGPVTDQAALHGLLRKVRNLGVPLVSVIRVTPDQTNASDVTS